MTGCATGVTGAVLLRECFVCKTIGFYGSARNEGWGLLSATEVGSSCNSVCWSRVVTFVPPK